MLGFAAADRDVTQMTATTITKEKPYSEMSDDELRAAMATWGAKVENAAGWPSAYFAAKQCAAIEVTARRRNLIIENKWKITVEAKS